MVRYLCERPEIDVAHINNTTSGSGLSALGDAAMRNRSRVLEVLLSHRADVNIRRHNGKTPLHAAAEEGHVDCVEVLLAANADVGAKDDRGCTAAELALSNAHGLRSPEVCQRIAKLLDAAMADIMMAPR
jgi:ankyrin repeat protein